MARTARWYYAINRRDLEIRNLTALLEMFRYDACTVELDEAGVVVFSGPKPPTEGRWSSFSMPIIYCEQDVRHLSDPYAIARLARASNGFRGI